jgi:hypothetical protein
MVAAEQLQPQQREQFLRQVAQVLNELPVHTRGPGIFYRLVTTIWRRYWDAPDLAGG